MGFRSSAKSSWIQTSAMWQVYKNFRRLMPTAPWNAAKLLEERASTAPNSVGLHFEGTDFTWAEINAKVNQYARWFQSEGIGKGDVVTLLMDNRADYLFIVTALNRLRAIAAAINSSISGAGLTHAITLAKPKLIIVGSEHSDSIADIEESLKGVAKVVSQTDQAQTDQAGENTEKYPAMDDAVNEQATALPEGMTDPVIKEAAVYIYTSGTTGLPKAAIVTNMRWVAAGYLIGGAVTRATSDDVLYLTLPLYHVSGLTGSWGNVLVTGAKLILRRKFSASKFWPDVQEHGVTLVPYVGELCRYLVNQPERPEEKGHKVRMAYGNGLRPDVWGPFQERFKIEKICEMYGATEGNALIANFEGKPGMLGRQGKGQMLAKCDPVSGDLVRNSAGFCETISVGEKGLLLSVITKVVTYEGYLDKKASNKKVMSDVFVKDDKYFNTGDLLHLHEDKWLSFADRVGDTFRWKGENVSTGEVAELVNGFDGVEETNVYGVKVEGAEGRAGMASICTGDGFDVDVFATYVVKNLAAYQRPYFLRLQDGMAITATFKHQKKLYQEEGYDPAKVSDALYFLKKDKYVRIDAELFKQLKSGQLSP
ncbi:MAG: long-chain-acyl-CoA synthetase [Polyangiaceae bacterium]|nr:long-chain-acyl-CoA synthetase [Polyangiaceae bacterium]